MFLILLCIWVILNGKFTLEILAFGIPVCGLLYLFLCRYMDYSLKKDLQIFRKAFDIARYVFVLVKEIVKANLTAIHLILTGRDEIQPALVTFRTKLKTKTARTFMANAITLTPGTITVTLTEDEYVVHCLDQDLAYGMDDTVFTKLLADLEKPGAGQGSEDPDGKEGGR